MKQIILVPFFLISILSYGQFIKGEKFLGGTFSFHTQRAPISQNGGLVNFVNSFSVGPSLGFLLNEKLAIGGQIGCSTGYSKNANYSTFISKTNSFSISSGVFVKRYFEISEHFLFSIEGQFQFMRGASTNRDTNTATGIMTKTKTLNYNLRTIIRPSFIFFPTPKWGFEASIGFISYSYSRDLITDRKLNLFGIEFGTVSLGLAYYFRK